MLASTRWVALSLLAAGVLAGCGGSSESATTQWAGNVCSAITTWQDAITAAGQSLKNDRTKDGLSSALDDTTGATETFVADLKDAGKPDTASGQQAKDSLDQLSQNLDDGVQKIKDAADGVSSVSEALSAVSVVSGTLATMGDQVSSTFTDLKQLDSKGELDTAFQQAGACDSLTKSNP